MKNRISISIIIASFILLGSMGCYKDVISPGSDPNGPPQDVSFSGDLIPMFNAHCNSSGCHDAGPAHKPSLVPENAYDALISGGYVNTAVPNESIIYIEVNSGGMPPTGALPPSDAKLILDWIRNGAQNN